MPSTTRALVRSAVRNSGGGAYRSVVVSDAELDAAFERARQELHQMLCSLDRTYQGQVTTLTFSGASASLPTGTLFVRSVGVADSDRATGYARIERCEWEQRDQFDNATVHHPECYVYTVYGDSLYLLPTPPSGTVVQVGYQAEAAALGNENTSFRLPPHAESWLIARLCAYCAAKVNEDPRAYYAQMEEAQGKLAAFARRDMAAAPRIFTRRTNRRFRGIGDFA